MSQNKEYDPGRFHTAVFGGFRKDDVLDYLDSLTEKIEQLREDKNKLEVELVDIKSQLNQEKIRADEMEREFKDADKERNEMQVLLNESEGLLDELEERNEECDKQKTELNELRLEKEKYVSLKTEFEQLRREKESLQQEKESLGKALTEAENQIENNEAKERYVALCKELEESIDSYEKQKAVVSDVLLNAKVEAEHILAEADSRANYILRQADHRAELKKQTTEAMLQRFATQNIGQLNFVIQHLQEYLDMLSNVYQGVDMARRGLSQSVIGIPQELEALQRMVKGDVVVESNSYKMDNMPQ